MKFVCFLQMYCFVMGICHHCAYTACTRIESTVLIAQTNNVTKLLRLSWRMIWKLRASQINGVGFRLYITRFRVDSEEEGLVMEGEVQVRRWDKGAGHNIKEKGSRSEAF